MSKQNEIGKKGEDLAVALLLNKEYKLLERNWRFSKAEIDIICKKDDLLVFVEVKTKSYNFFGEAAESVGAKKEILIADAAAAYMREVEHEWAFRFDIISILLPEGSDPIISHYEDAFFPGI